MQSSVSSLPRIPRTWLGGLEATSRWEVFRHDAIGMYRRSFATSQSCCIACTTAVVQTMVWLDQDALNMLFFARLTTRLFLSRSLVRLLSRMARLERVVKRLYSPTRVARYVQVVTSPSVQAVFQISSCF